SRSSKRSNRRFWSPWTTSIRPRKFYATRHTFISVALSKGANLKWVARYCGTSVEMIDEHYGKWLGDDGGQLAILAPAKQQEQPRARRFGPRRCNAWCNLSAGTEKAQAGQSGGGEIRTPEGVTTLAVFKTAALNRARPPLPGAPAYTA